MNPNQFAFDFYQQVRSGHKNLVVSPYSVWQALAMTYIGARANTEAQLARVCNFDLPQQELHAAVQTLASKIARWGELVDKPPAPPIEKPHSGVYDASSIRHIEYERHPIQLTIANGLWAQAGLPFEPDFLQNLAHHYASECFQADFRKGSLDKIADDINAWVAQNTQQKIKSIVTPNNLSPQMLMVLINAIYFRGQWEYPFFPNQRYVNYGQFHLLDGTVVSVPTMVNVAPLHYHVGPEYVVVDMPYHGTEGESAAMLLIMPPEGQFEAFESRFDSRVWSAILNEIQNRRDLLDLDLPSFGCEIMMSLRGTLQAMGVMDAFDLYNANFTGIASLPEGNSLPNKLFFSEVLHKTYINVDEQGTEAAGVAAVMMGAGGAAIRDKIEIRFDRPFLYAIYDKPTGTILFMGRVMNPAE